MKRIIVVLFAAILSTSAFAQQKIGHINSLTILQAMPEFKSMSEAIEKKKKDYQGVMEKMYGEYESKQKELQALADKAASQTDPVIEMKIKELQDLQQRIQAFEEKVNDELQKYQADLLKPINDKYLAAVKEVAKANGYAYIIDVVSGALAYFPEDAGDVTDLVMKKLGITAAPPAAPKTAPK